VPDGAVFSAKLMDVESGEVLYAENTNALLNPASTLKTFTFYLALKKLGEEFQYKTQLLADTKNLYIKFSGDPTLTLQNLDDMFASLPKKKNFLVIYLDGEIFGEEPYAPGMPVDNLKFSYAAPSSAFSIDQNYIIFNKVEGANFVYQPSNSFDFLKLRNRAIHREDALCPLELFATGVNEYTLEGCYGAKNIPQKLQIAVTDPKKYAHDIIQALLKKHNITVQKIIFGKAPNSATVVAEHASETLPNLLRKVMYDSDNHISNSLVRIMAYQRFQKPASWFLAQEFLKESVGELGFDPEKIQLVEGSGLSKKNFVTVDFMTLLLQTIHKDPDLRKYYYTATTTLAEVFKNADWEGKLSAKTGTLDHVFALTGFVMGQDGKVYAFSFNTNNFLGSPKVVKSSYEQILKDLEA
jgi:D-alanyl-D-alanine carboxypeptidase/D-alanyl-D-alanine-endopeptidase (penicillin-binding protein 4)